MFDSPNIGEEEMAIDPGRSKVKVGLVREGEMHGMCYSYVISDIN